MKRSVELASLKLWLTSSLLIAGLVSTGQNIPVGSWRTHFSYKQVLILEQTSNKVFCAATNGIFSIDLQDNSINRLSKIDGLSDVKASSLAYSATLNLLVIGYESGLVDFIFEDRIETITDLFNSNLEGDKKINDIVLSGDEAFLATDLGIIVVAINEVSIRENFVQIGQDGAEVSIEEIELFDGILFANTSLGLQSGDLDNNLLDFNNWDRYVGTEALENLVLLEGTFYARDDENLYQFSGTWVDTSIDLPSGTSQLFVSNNNLLTASSDSIYSFSGSQFEETFGINATLINDLIQVEGVYWLADDSLGLISQNNEQLSPSGPISDQFSRIKVENGAAYGFHAPDVSTYDGSERVEGYSIFSNGQWEIQTINGFQNVSDVAFFGSNRFFSSIGDGLYDENSELVIGDIPSSLSEPDTLITGLTSSASLWVSSYNVFQPLHQFNENGWQSFLSSQTISNRFTSIDVSQLGILWLSGTLDGIVNFDPNEGRSQLLSASSGVPGTVTDVELSIDDNVWVSTIEGPTTFADASFIFELNEAIQPTQEGRVLFEGENINAIETDGGNRVWFATDRGLWLFDENITEQVALFNFDNSPLPSDVILDLAYDGITGELFVLTNKGLVSYRSASSFGSAVHETVNVFPNPVRPGFEGLVGINGLAKNVSIKVTDVNGILVKEIQANGGAAAWDLRNNANARVSTGIYLLFSSTSDGEETYVGKVAVIR